jgi:hypothetical protein
MKARQLVASELLLLPQDVSTRERGMATEIHFG